MEYQSIPKLKQNMYSHGKGDVSGHRENGMRIGEVIPTAREILKIEVRGDVKYTLMRGSSMQSKVATLSPCPE